MCEIENSGDDCHVYAAPPESCDICAAALTTAFHEGKARQGGWRFMCSDCCEQHGIGLYQSYHLSADMRFRAQEDAP